MEYQSRHKMAEKRFRRGLIVMKLKWWCHGYGAFLSEEACVDVGVGGEEPCKKGVVVNRGCENVRLRAF